MPAFPRRRCKQASGALSWLTRRLRLKPPQNDSRGAGRLPVDATRAGIFRFGANRAEGSKNRRCPRGLIVAASHERVPTRIWIGSATNGLADTTRAFTRLACSVSPLALPRRMSWHAMRHSAPLLSFAWKGLILLRLSTQPSRFCGASSNANRAAHCPCRRSKSYESGA